MSGVERLAVRNRLLTTLPPESFARIAPALERVGLPSNLCLHGAGEPIGAVHFVEAGAVSLMTLMTDGNHVESGTVGREGFVGLPLLLGADAWPAEARVQMPGAALRLGAARFHDAVEEDAGLRLLLLRFTLAFHGLVAQTAACNARHHLEQRLARWLLIAHDRAESDELPLTHEFLSVMLGVRRAGVTVAAGILRDEGLIRYDRGHVTILDRPGLEATSCECRGAMRAEFTRLLGRAGAGGV
jgi:CRP-like cAMP-binding protein